MPDLDELQSVVKRRARPVIRDAAEREAALAELDRLAREPLTLEVGELFEALLAAVDAYDAALPAAPCCPPAGAPRLSRCGNGRRRPTKRR